MICPNCGSDNNHVTDTIPDNGNNYIFRRRRCIDCGVKFRTSETIIADTDSLGYRFSVAEYDKTRRYREERMRKRQ